MRVRLTFLLLTLTTLTAPWPAAADFEGLGTLPGGDYFVSQALGVSGDGRIVVGSGSQVSNIPDCCVVVDEQAIRWEAGILTGMKSLVTNHERSIARAASYDGSVITGNLYRGSPWQGGFVWQSGAVTSMGDLPGGSVWSIGRAISAAGDVIAGASPDAINDRAVRWDAGTLTNLGSGLGWSYGHGVTADGATVVGFQQTEGAKRWDGTIISGLASPPGDFETRAFGISANGSVIVGRSLQSAGELALLWDEGVPALLGTLPGDLTSVATDASADGSVVVGYSATSGGVRRAFVWTPSEGMRVLRDLLVDQGDDMTGWALDEAWGISDDGTVIVGDGVHPNGRARGWVATLPSLGGGSGTPVPSLGGTASVLLVAMLLAFGAGTLSIVALGRVR